MGDALLLRKEDAGELGYIKDDDSGLVIPSKYVSPAKYSNESDLYSNPAIKKLLNSIEEEPVRDFLVNDFLREQGSEYDDEGVNHGAFLQTRKYFKRNSAISSGVMSNPGTSVVTELLYEKNPMGAIDEYFCDCESGDAIKDRLDTLVENVTGMIQDRMGPGPYNGKTRIVNIGSGPGMDTTRSISNLSDDERKHVKGLYLDKDGGALKEALELAKDYGVEDNIETYRADLLQLFNPLWRAYNAAGNVLKEMKIYRSKNLVNTGNLIGKNDIGLEIGIICPLGKKNSISAIKGGALLLNDEGNMIVSAAHKNMKKADPFTDYLMANIGAWKLIYKDESTLEKLYGEAGLDLIDMWYDEPRHFHMLGVGKKRKKRLFSFSNSNGD